MNKYLLILKTYHSLSHIQKQKRKSRKHKKKCKNFKSSELISKTLNLESKGIVKDIKNKNKN